MQKDYILFDLDGTLTDPKEGITKAVQYSLKYFGIEADTDDLLPFIGPPLRESFKEFYGFDDEKANLAVQKYREYFSEKGIFENLLYEGMDNLLKTLKDSGKTLIVATSKPAVFAERILRYFGIRHYFSFVSGSELNGERSEKWEVIEYVFECCNITAKERAVMIGDRKHDIIGAKKTGIESIGVLYGYGSAEELRTAGANYIAEDIDELMQILF